MANLVSYQGEIYTTNVNIAIETLSMGLDCGRISIALYVTKSLTCNIPLKFPALTEVIEFRR